MLSMRRLLKNVNRVSISNVLSKNLFIWTKHDIGASLKDTVHKPHTVGYLQDQKQICDKYNLPSKFVHLPAKTKLISFFITGDMLLGSTAVYPKESITRLTDKEFAKIRSWVGNYLSEDETNEPIDCIALEEKNGRVAYYIYPEKLNRLKMTPLEESISKGEIAPDSAFKEGFKL